MPKQYKQAYVLTMENGKIALWTGKAENKQHGEGLAIASATQKHGCAVWAIANRPVISKRESK